MTTHTTRVKRMAKPRPARASAKVDMMYADESESESTRETKPFGQSRGRGRT